MVSRPAGPIFRMPLATPRLPVTDQAAFDITYALLRLYLIAIRRLEYMVAPDRGDAQDYRQVARPRGAGSQYCESTSNGRPR